MGAYIHFSLYPVNTTYNSESMGDYGGDGGERGSVPSGFQKFVLKDCFHRLFNQFLSLTLYSVQSIICNLKLSFLKPISKVLQFETLYSNIWGTTFIFRISLREKAIDRK